MKSLLVFMITLLTVNTYSQIGYGGGLCHPTSNTIFSSAVNYDSMKTPCKTRELLEEMIRLQDLERENIGKEISFINNDDNMSPHFYYDSIVRVQGSSEMKLGQVGILKDVGVYHPSIRKYGIRYTIEFKGKHSSYSTFTIELVNNELSITDFADFIEQESIRSFH